MIGWVPGTWSTYLWGLATAISLDINKLFEKVARWTIKDQTIIANVDNVAEQKDVDVVEVATSEDVVSMILFKNNKIGKYICRFIKVKKNRDLKINVQTCRFESIQRRD